MTREEAIKCLVEEIRVRSECYQSYLAHYGKQDIAEEEFLESLHMALSALREQPRWFPVTERLPEKCGQYIAVVKYNHKRDEKEAVTDIDIATWGEVVSLVTGDRFFEWTSLLNDWDEGNGAEITHWMPLLEPPKEEV